MTAPQHAALLVMDYQNGIVGSLPDADAQLERAAEAIATVRHLGGHVGHVRVAFTEDDLAGVPETNPMFARLTQSAGSFGIDAPGTQIHERVAPQDGDIVVRKTRVGAFSTTDLADQLAARGVTTLILAGISTSGVVLSTVRDAADRDYELLVLADGCADPHADVHAILLEKVFPRQARVLEIAELEAALSERPA
jgi:nicotinamidase-related amidase